MTSICWIVVGPTFNSNTPESAASKSRSVRSRPAWYTIASSRTTRQLLYKEFLYRKTKKKRRLALRSLYCMALTPWLQCSFLWTLLWISFLEQEDSSVRTFTFLYIINYMISWSQSLLMSTDYFRAYNNMWWLSSVYTVYCVKYRLSFVTQGLNRIISALHITFLSLECLQSCKGHDCIPSAGIQVCLKFACLSI